MKIVNLFQSVDVQKFRTLTLGVMAVFAVLISVTKEGVKFSTRGDIGTANIVCRQNITVDKVSDVSFVLNLNTNHCWLTTRRLLIIKILFFKDLILILI